MNKDPLLRSRRPTAISKHINTKGFTLIEVLIALTILAISLTALIKTTSTSIRTTKQLEDRVIGHLVSMQAISRIQAGLVELNVNQTVQEEIQLLHQTWYWKAEMKRTPWKKVDKIIIRSSPNKQGPFTMPWIAYRGPVHAH